MNTETNILTDCPQCLGIVFHPSWDVPCPHCSGSGEVLVPRSEWLLQSQAEWDMDRSDDSFILESFLDLPVKEEEEEMDYITWYETFGDDFKTEEI